MSETSGSGRRPLSQSSVEEPKFELWQARQWEGVYCWMVWDYAKMDATWFEREDEARAFLKRKREGRRADTGAPQGATPKKGGGGSSMSRMSESKLERLGRLLIEATPRPWRHDFDGMDGHGWVAPQGMYSTERTDNELVVEAVNALPELLRGMAALEELTASCEEEFAGDGTEEFSDEEAVAAPSSHISFGMIRRARAALSALDEGAAE